MSANWFSKSPSPVDNEVTCLEAELLQRKKVAVEVRELQREEVEEARCQWKAQEEARWQEEEVKQQEKEEWGKQQEAEEE